MPPRSRADVISPMLATLARDVVTGPQWVFEEKYDGIRALAYRRSGVVRLYSRNRIERTGGFPRVVHDVAALPGGDLIMDGELVSFDTGGASSFQLLQQRELGRRIGTYFAVFDVLEKDGADLMTRPLTERRKALEELLPKRKGSLLASRRLVRDGEKAYRIAQEKQWEGIIAKDESSVYEAGARSRAWLKVKVRRESEFVIGGYTSPGGARTHFGALLVGLYDGDDLRFTGKVGTGFTGAVLGSLAAKMDRLRTAKPPFTPPPRLRDATWVRPKLVAQIAYMEWTGDGKLRQPVYLGLRDDKRPEECRWSERE